ncbi:MAG: glycosyltransferase family 1 protein, partial [Daejeonella sp.]
MRYPYTGLFEYCYKLGLNLVKTQAQNDDVTFYLAPSDQHYFTESLEFIDQKSFHKLLFPKLNSEIDIWHSTHQTSWYMPPRSRKIKCLLTIHDLNFLYEEKRESKRLSLLKKHQKSIDLADHIVAISEFTKSDILKHLKTDKPITVIYNGCDVEEFPEHENPVYKPNREFILALGTVNEKKNFHVLPCLLAKNEMEIVIAGKVDDNYKALILAEAKKFNVLNRVKILGNISKQDKYWYYKHCTAFSLPSKAEGFGIPVIEAMYFGKPVFLSKLTSLPEIGGKLAYYFDNFDDEHMQDVFETGMKNYRSNNPSEEIINHAKEF